MNALGLDEQHALLKIVVERLARCNIPYMVAGSVAANSYTAARTTADLDVIIKIGEEDIDKLIAAFENVLATQAGNLDLDYLRLWAARLNLSQELEALL